MDPAVKNQPRISLLPTRITASRMALAALLFVSASAADVSLRNTIIPQGIIIHHAAVPPAAVREFSVAEIDRIHEAWGFGAFYWGRIFHIFAGVGSMVVLFAASLLYLSIRDMVKGRVTGRGVAVAYAGRIGSSPLFWLVAAIAFCMVAFLAKT